MKKYSLVTLFGALLPIIMTGNSLINCKSVEGTAIPYNINSYIIQEDSVVCFETKYLIEKYNSVECFVVESPLNFPLTSNEEFNIKYIEPLEDTE
jgi:hypothetical protein